LRGLTNCQSGFLKEPGLIWHNTYTRRGGLTSSNERVGAGSRPRFRGMSKSRASRRPCCAS